MIATDDLKRKLRPALTLLLLRTIGASNSWSGEAKVQEGVFFLQEGLEIPLDFPFILYGHGPFSFELRELLGALRAGGFIEIRTGSPMGPSLEVAPLGISLLDRYAELSRPYADSVERVAGELSAREVAELERLGTSLFVSRKNRHLSQSERAKLVVGLKPHILEGQANEAVRWVDGLLGAAIGHPANFADDK